MPLRIGFDMDGTLADFESAFHAVEVRLFGRESHIEAGQPERESEEPPVAVGTPPGPPAVTQGKKRSLVQGRRRRDQIWDEIRKTPNFWSTLTPLDPRAVRRVYDLTLEHKWEVFFITQRPYTEGETVQRQTQRWLADHGFDMPSVLVIGGSRGAAAAALRLDYHVDDSPQNCLDVASESGARPILLVPDNNEATITQARKLKIGTAPSIAAALDVLDKATLARTQPTILDRIAAIVGWSER
jgi:phosphoglycolate phosphatase-like HAD superfamily hydrolase